MSLTIPSGLSSFESNRNLNRILSVNWRGGKEQLATRVALRCFERIEQLRPGYCNGIKRWFKYGLFFASRGTIAAAVLGGGGWGLYKAMEAMCNAGYFESAGFGSVCLKDAGGFWKVANDRLHIGVTPLQMAAAFLAAATWNAASRAAKWSFKQDEKELEVKAVKSRECHEKIKSELTLVFDDVAQYLREMYQHAAVETESDEKSKGALRLEAIADQLDRKMPSLEIVLKKFKFSIEEREDILLQLKDAVRFIQTEAYELKPNQGQRNTKILFSARLSDVASIAVPVSIRERIATTKQSEEGFSSQLRSCGKAMLAGGEVFVGLAALSGAAAFLYDAGISGGLTNVGFSNAWNHVAGLNFAKVSTLASDYRISAACALIGMLGAAIYAADQAIEKESLGIEHNAEYVKQTLRSCRKELLEIYDGVALSGDMEEPALRAQLRKKTAVIREEIEKLGLGPDFSRRILLETDGDRERERYYYFNA